jgi:hypothetical protein
VTQAKNTMGEEKRMEFGRELSEGSRHHFRRRRVCIDRLVIDIIHAEGRVGVGLHHLCGRRAAKESGRFARKRLILTRAYSKYWGLIRSWRISSITGEK